MNETHHLLLVPSFVAFTLGMTVYFLGAMLTRRSRLLRDFNIPVPVSGGLCVALLIWAIRAWGGVEFRFELAARTSHCERGSRRQRLRAGWPRDTLPYALGQSLLGQHARPCRDDWRAPVLQEPRRSRARGRVQRSLCRGRTDRQRTHNPARAGFDRNGERARLPRPCAPDRSATGRPACRLRAGNTLDAHRARADPRRSGAVGRRTGA